MGQVTADQMLSVLMAGMLSLSLALLSWVARRLVVQAEHLDSQDDRAVELRRIVDVGLDRITSSLESMDRRVTRLEAWRDIHQASRTIRGSDPP